jgi:hypothetical protein
MSEMISVEVAEKELQEWFEKNYISEEKQEAFQESVKIIKSAIQKGRLILQEDGKLKMNLISPIGSVASPVNELVFNARVNRKMVMPHLNGVKADNNDMRLLAYMAASTGKNKTILMELMPEDQVLADNITVFFVN